MTFHFFLFSFTLNFTLKVFFRLRVPFHRTFKRVHGKPSRFWNPRYTSALERVIETEVQDLRFVDFRFAGLLFLRALALESVLN